MGDNFEEHSKLPELKLGTIQTLISYFNFILTSLLTWDSCALDAKQAQGFISFFRKLDAVSNPCTSFYWFYLQGVRVGANIVLL